MNLDNKLENLRRNYDESALDLPDLAESPIAQFSQWFEQARQAESADWFEANAMTLATADTDGRVSARIVLLKQFSEAGFAFFTNYQSAKAKQLADNPCASLLFYWPHVERQVRIEGKVCKTDSETSDTYFHERPRGSQIGAVASPQSSPLKDRDELEQVVEKLTNQFGDEPIPRPDYWGGYQVVPVSFEFWQGRPSRLHDRFTYAKQSDGTWCITRLAP